MLEDAIFLPISAKIGTNLELLKETIISVANSHEERMRERDKEKDERMKNMLKNIAFNKNNNIDDDRKEYYNNSSSTGVLLDVIKSRKLGSTLHVVVRDGQVRSSVGVHHNRHYYCSSLQLLLQFFILLPIMCHNCSFNYYDLLYDLYHSLS